MDTALTSGQYRPSRFNGTGGALATAPPMGALGEFLAAPDDYLEPKYPAWLYRIDPTTGERKLAPPEMPPEQRFRDWITGDTLLYADLINRFRRDLMTYRRLRWGVNSKFNPDVDASFVKDEVAIQVNKMAAMLANTPLQVNYTWRTKKERLWAQAMEAFDLWFLEHAEQIHRAEGNHDLYWDLAWSGLIYGRQVIEVGCDLYDPDFPFHFTVHDPACVFPIWGRGKQGMLRCSKQYQTTVADILDEFDASGQDNLADKLASYDQKKRKTKTVDLDFTEERTINECTTRWQRYVDVDGFCILKTDHEYGAVNVIYNLSMGEMGGASTPLRGRRAEGLSRRDIEQGMGVESGRARQYDQVEKGVSFFHAITNALRQRERVLGMHMTGVQQGINPPTFITNPFSWMPEPFDFGPGGRNELKPGQQAQPVFTSPRPLDSAPVLDETQSELNRGMLPPVVFGSGGDSQLSGFQQDTMIAAARDVIGPYEKLQTYTIADILVWKSRLYRNFGHSAEGLVGGELVIPRQNREHGAGSGGTPAKPPQWAMPILQKMMELTTKQLAPQSAQPGAATAAGIPGGGGLMGSDVPGAPMPFRSPQAQVLLGMPGYVDPQWLVPEEPIYEDAPEFVITPQIIDAISTRPKITLNSLGLQSRTVLANYLDIVVRGNMMSSGTAMDQLPEIQDTLAEWNNMMAEKASTNPDTLRLIEYPRALLRQGDVEGWLAYYAIVLLPTIIGQMNQSTMAMQASPGGPPRGAPSSPNPNQIQGGSPAMLNAPPGAQGAPVGRPA